MIRESVAAIVPARDEAPRIAETVRTLRSIEEIDEVVVVDDASEDGTMRIAEEAGARAYRLERRTGKGGALRFAIARTDAPVLAFIDGDLGTTASVARPLLTPILAGDADMTVARPPEDRPSGFGLVEGLSRWGIRRLTGRNVDRPLSGQRALRREVLERCPIAERFGVETALTIDALLAGFRVLEVPLRIEHRRTGRDMHGFVHRARQGVDVATVLATRMLEPRR